MKKTKTALVKQLSLQKKTITILESPQRISGGAVTQGVRCLTQTPTCGESCNTFQPGREYCIYC
ncbi:hypothetical protein [Taibaiella koreensis]|uniref:hypothetical protein n=1 Tax=Taibaiella koreensis TaxID=1268548 RepID=UPI0013C34AA7|nr:hypothetical protein [Taibaiella koreensis]